MLVSLLACEFTHTGAWVEYERFFVCFFYFYLQAFYEYQMSHVNISYEQFTQSRLYPAWSKRPFEALFGKVGGNQWTQEKPRQTRGNTAGQPQHQPRFLHWSYKFSIRHFVMSCTPYNLHALGTFYYFNSNSSSKQHQINGYILWGCCKKS